ncbi:MAG: hypothetical protein P8166_03730 [Candidatus Thiodiazotropha sp.]
MELLARRPELVEATILYDPMCVAILPDAETEVGKFVEYDQINLKQSSGDAMAAFLSDFEPPYPEEFRRAMKREGRQVVLELRSCATYHPNIEKLRKHRKRLVMVTGQQC